MSVNTAAQMAVAPVLPAVELLREFTESEHNHLKHCRENVYYPGLGLMDDRCDLCRRADALIMAYNR